MRIIVGITGSSGVIYGIKIMESLHSLDIETHLILSEWGANTIKIETDTVPSKVKSLATYFYYHNNK